MNRMFLPALLLAGCLCDPVDASDWVGIAIIVDGETSAEHQRSLHAAIDAYGLGSKVSKRASGSRREQYALPPEQRLTSGAAYFLNVSKNHIERCTFVALSGGAGVFDKFIEYEAEGRGPDSVVSGGATAKVIRTPEYSPQPGMTVIPNDRFVVHSDGVVLLGGKETHQFPTRQISKRVRAASSKQSYFFLDLAAVPLEYRKTVFAQIVRRQQVTLQQRDGESEGDYEQRRKGQVSFG
jgi:hypothetical protein